MGSALSLSWSSGPSGACLASRNPWTLQSPEVFRRIIVYVQADDLKHYDPLARRMCWFNGWSVSNLRDALANLLNEDNSLNITLCTRAGFQGQPIPLVVDLSRGHEPMFVIVLNTGSPAAEELVYLDVGAR